MLPQDLTHDVSPDGRGWKRLTTRFHRLDPLFHDLAEFRVDVRLIVAVAAWTDDPGTLTHEAAIFVRPFDELDVPGAVFHDWTP
jgi:hypothetical protein